MIHWWQDKPTIPTAPSTKSRAEQVQIGGYVRNEEWDINTFLSKEEISVEKFVHLKYNVEEGEKYESQMQEELLPFLGKLLPQNLELLDTHALNSANLKLTPGSDEPHNLVDFTIVWEKKSSDSNVFHLVLWKWKKMPKILSRPRWPHLTRKRKSFIAAHRLALKFSNTSRISTQRSLSPDERYTLR